MHGIEKTAIFLKKMNVLKEFESETINCSVLVSESCIQN